MNLSEKLTDKLVNSQIINDEEKDLYYYGFKQGFLLLLNMVTVIIIGIIFNMVWQSVVFMISYSLLRVYAGGYHANTQLRCYLFFIGMITAVLWLMKFIPWNSFICLMITAVSSMVILLMAPVEDTNKPLDQKEKEIFKKQTNIVLAILIGFVLFFWLMGGRQVPICIVMAIWMVSAMLVLGRIKNKYAKTIK